MIHGLVSISQPFEVDKEAESVAISMMPLRF
jgi:hypothetical protein